MKLVVTDLDTADNGAPFTFDIVAGNDDGEFHVNNKGVLSTAGKLSKQVSFFVCHYEATADVEGHFILADVTNRHTCTGIICACT